jgi:hypothetical protein
VRKPIRFDQSVVPPGFTPCLSPFLRCTTSGQPGCCRDDRPSTLLPCHVG